MKWPFRDIFSFGVNKILRLQNHAEPTRCKQKSLQNPDFEAIYHFSVNSYHTSVERKSNSLTFQLYRVKNFSEIEQNQN